MALNPRILLTIFLLLGLACQVFSMEHSSLRASQLKQLGISTIGLVVEGFAPDSVFRTRLTIKAGLDGAEVVDLTLNDLKSMSVGGTDIKLLVAPSAALPGSDGLVKEIMGLLSGLVQKGALLISQVDSSSPLCREFDYDGVKTTNSPYIYDGLCVGPITNTGPMENECRAISALVDSKTKMITYNNFFVHNGFYFVDAELNANCRILASGTPRKNSQSLIEFRKNTNAVALVVACKYGNGASILSGIQLDQNKAFFARHVEKNPGKHVESVLSHLSDLDDFRTTLLHYITMLKFTASQE